MGDIHSLESCLAGKSTSSEDSVEKKAARVSFIHATRNVNYYKKRKMLTGVPRDPCAKYGAVNYGGMRPYRGCIRCNIGLLFDCSLRSDF